jgi:hypothetical protein
MTEIANDVSGLLNGYNDSPTIVMGNYKSLPTVLAPDRRTLTRVKAAWLAAGYPKTFPTIRDVDRMSAAADRLFTAARRGDITPLPAIYLDYNSALAQYANDANDTLCPE